MGASLWHFSTSYAFRIVKHDLSEILLFLTFLYLLLYLPPSSSSSSSAPSIFYFSHFFPFLLLLLCLGRQLFNGSIWVWVLKGFGGCQPALCIILMKKCSIPAGESDPCRKCKPTAVTVGLVCDNVTEYVLPICCSGICGIWWPGVGEERVGEGLWGFPAVSAGAPAGLGQEEGGSRRRIRSRWRSRRPATGDQGQTHTVACPGKTFVLYL